MTESGPGLDFASFVRAHAEGKLGLKNGDAAQAVHDAEAILAILRVKTMREARELLVNNPTTRWTLARFARAALLKTQFEQATRQDADGVGVTGVSSGEDGAVGGELGADARATGEGEEPVDHGVRDGVMPDGEPDEDTGNDSIHKNTELPRNNLHTSHPEGPDIGYYERLFHGVPDRLSAPTPAAEEVYESNSKNRLALLNEKLGNKLGGSTVELSSTQVAALLVEYARAQPTSGRDRLLPDHRAVFSVMLWKYFQGAFPILIEGTARSVCPPGPGLAIGSVQARFVSFAAERLMAEDPEAFRVRKKRISPPAKTSSLDDDIKAFLRSRDEAELSMRYHGPEVVDTTATKARLADQISRTLGGNVGAYRRMFDLPAGVRVESADTVDARQKLWTAVEQNIQEQGTTALGGRLNKHEIKWIALLCGKKFVPDHKNRRLNVQEETPRTLSGVRGLVHNMYRPGLGQRPDLTPDGVEYILCSAFQKIISSRPTS